MANCCPRGSPRRSRRGWPTHAITLGTRTGSRSLQHVRELQQRLRVGAAVSRDLQLPFPSPWLVPFPHRRTTRASSRICPPRVYEHDELAPTSTLEQPAGLRAVPVVRRGRVRPRGTVPPDVAAEDQRDRRRFCSLRRDLHVRRLLHGSLHRHRPRSRRCSRQKRELAGFGQYSDVQAFPAYHVVHQLRGSRRPDARRNYRLRARHRRANAEHLTWWSGPVARRIRTRTCTIP